MKSHELIAFVSHRLSLEILEDMAGVDKAIYRAVLESVAQARKLRPIFLERQPRPKRHDSMIGTLSRPASDNIAENLLRAWLLNKHKGLLCDFLDALAIGHKEGVVDDLPATVEDTKLTEAIERVLGKYRPEVVSLYLHAFSEMNGANWPNLEKILREDPRLELGVA